MGYGGMPTYYEKLAANVYFEERYLVLERVTDDPVNPGFTVDTLLYGSSENDYFTIEGSLYFENGRRIRLCHSDGPKVSDPKLNLRRFALTKTGESYYDDFSTLIDKELLYSQKMIDGLNAINAISAVRNQNNTLNPGTIVEFWDNYGHHASRGKAVNVQMTQMQLNALYLSAFLEDNTIMKQTWIEMGITCYA